MSTTKTKLEIIELISRMSSKQLSQEEVTPTLVFLACLVSMLIGVIYADDTETEAEIQQAAKILYLFSPPESKLHKPTFQMIKRVRENSEYTEPLHLQRLTEGLSKSERLLLICFGYDLSLVDGILGQSEKMYLRRISSAINVEIKYQRVLEAEFSGQKTVNRNTLPEMRSLLEPNRFSNLGVFVNAAKTILTRLMKYKRVSQGRQ